MKKTSAALMALPLVASLLLAGCGGSAKPEASRTSTPSSSPTSTAPPTASPSSTSTVSRAIDPNIPQGARAHTTAGAEAFVRYFIERSNEAWTAPRTGILSPLCQTSAVACIALEKDATRLAKVKHHYDGDPVTIKFVGALNATSPNMYNVLANLVQERRSEIDGTGKVYVTDSRKDLRFNFALLYTGSAWSVASMKLVK